MKIDQMMAEIRETHPEARVRRPVGEGGTWAVFESNLSHAGRISQARNKGSAVLAAYHAVRKARPRPMTVAQAKAFVLEKRPASVCQRANDGGWFVFDLSHSWWMKIPVCDTEGQAWKAAAAAIRASEKGKS